MATAYTPGLTVSSGQIIKRQRRLPTKGNVLVSLGDKISADTVVAQSLISGIIQTIRVAETLGIEPDDAIKALQIKEGDKIEAGQLIAESKSFFGLFKSECKAPSSGTVEFITHSVGHIGLRMPPKPVEVNGYIDGVVTQIMENEGIVVETYGALIQGIFGIGGERHGKLVFPAKSADEILTVNHMKSGYNGNIVVGGSLITLDGLKAASVAGVAGVIVGAVVDMDLIEYLGYDIGVAITGQEDIITTVILTEGFGSINMAKRTYELLRSLEGHKVSINGSTQIRAGVIRPEIIASIKQTEKDIKGTFDVNSLEIGSLIRIIREPYFGRLAEVISLPNGPAKIETGAVVRVLEVKTMDDKSILTIPRTNVELIKE